MPQKPTEKLNNANKSKNNIHMYVIIVHSDPDN